MDQHAYPLSAAHWLLWFIFASIHMASMLDRGATITHVGVLPAQTHLYIRHQREMSPSPSPQVTGAATGTGVRASGGSPHYTGSSSTHTSRDSGMADRVLLCYQQACLLSKWGCEPRQRWANGTHSQPMP